MCTNDRDPQTVFPGEQRALPGPGPAQGAQWLVLQRWRRTAALPRGQREEAAATQKTR